MQNTLIYANNGYASQWHHDKNTDVSVNFFLLILQVIQWNKKCTKV